MSLRLSASILLLALVPLVGCTWEGRPDGSAGVHSDSDGYFDDGVDPIETPLGGGPIVSDVEEPVEPLGDDALAPTEAPVLLDQPAPTTGTDDNTSEVEEALTPGTEL